MSRTFLGIAIELWERVEKKKKKKQQPGLVRKELNFDQVC